MGTDDFFVVKYTSLGNLVWAKNFGGTGEDQVHGIVVGADNNIYITGNFSSSDISFGSTTLGLSKYYNSSNNKYSIYWAKLDTMGSPIWAKQTNGGAMVTNIASNRSGEIYIGGDLTDTIVSFGSNVLHNGNNNPFLCRFNSDGFINLAKAFSSSATSSLNAIWGITVDPCNDVWVSGGMDSMAGYQLRLDSSTIAYAPPGRNDPLFLAEYNEGGALLDYKTLISGGDDNSGLATDQSGNIYLSGDYYGVDPFAVGSTSLTPFTNYLESYFVAKYRPVVHCDLSVQSQQQSIDRVALYPNPTSTSLTISSTDHPINQITITNLLGQTVYTHNYNAEQVQVDVANLPTGLYVVKINGSEVRKFVKE